MLRFIAIPSVGPVQASALPFKYSIDRGDGEQKANLLPCLPVDEGRKRVIGVMASILASLHMQTADDLFGCPQGSPRTDS
jgi:hypothetical protein